MSGEDFKSWLKLYGQTWQDKEPIRFSELFTFDAKYFRTPFEKAKSGREEIRAAFEAEVSTQDNIKFGYEVISFDKNIGVCRWWCKFTRISSQNLIKLDGVFICEFDKNNVCLNFREWRHKDGE